YCGVLRMIGPHRIGLAYHTDVIMIESCGENMNMTEANGQPTLTVVDDYEAMSRRAADVVTETITVHPTSAITVPTGSTPVGMYAELVRRIKNGDADFSQT